MFDMLFTKNSLSVPGLSFSDPFSSWNAFHSFRSLEGYLPFTQETLQNKGPGKIKSCLIQTQAKSIFFCWVRVYGDFDVIALNVIFLIFFGEGGYNFELATTNDVYLCLRKINVVSYYMFVHRFWEPHNSDP